MGGFPSTSRSRSGSLADETIAPEPRTVDSLIPHADMAPAVGGWVKGELIGTGAFGKVYLGLNTVTGHLMAVKEMEVDELTTQNTMEDFRKEIQLMSRLDHPNIVRYFGFEHAVRERRVTGHVFMEYVAGGSLATLLKKFGGFNEGLVRLYTEQMLQGLYYLHNNNIIHRDIKGANVLMDKEGQVKLADFGASKQLSCATNVNDGVHSLRGTPYYMAPEAIKQEAYGRKADVWSLGCTVLQMLTANHPWSENKFANPAAALLHIAMTTDIPVIPPDLSPPLLDFLHKCLERDPNDRETTAGLLHHTFITEGDQAHILPESTRHLGTSPTHSSPSGAASLGVDIDFSSDSFAKGHYTGGQDSPPAEEVEDDSCFNAGLSLDAGTVKLWSKLVGQEKLQAGLTDDLAKLSGDQGTGLAAVRSPGLRTQWRERERQLRERMEQEKQRSKRGGLSLSGSLSGKI